MSQAILYLLKMPGCPACAQARPIVRRVVKKHPGVKLVEVDLTSIEWGAKKWTPSITPTLILLVPGRRPVIREDEVFMGEEALDRWLSERS